MICMGVVLTQAWLFPIVWGASMLAVICMGPGSDLYGGRCHHRDPVRRRNDDGMYGRVAVICMGGWQ